MLLKKHVLAVFILGVVVLSGFAPALGTASDISSNAVAPLVVQFGDTVEEMVGITELKTNFPEAIVVDFLSQNQILSFAGPIIYIGHGSEEGIMYNGKTVSWDLMKVLIQRSVSKNHYILGCESTTLSQLTKYTGKDVFTFENTIDAIFGANIISLRITQYVSNPKIVFSFIEKIALRGIELINNPAKALTLKLWGEEVNTLGVIGLSIFVTLFPTTGAIVAIDAAKFAVALLGVAPSVFKLLNTVKLYIDGKNPDLFEVLSDLATVIFTIGKLVKIVISGFLWYRKGVSNAAFASDSISNAVATVAKILLLSASLAIVISSVLLFLWDFVDADGTYW